MSIQAGNSEEHVVPGVVGNWDIQVDLRDCATGERIARFQAEVNFALGGSLTEYTDYSKPTFGNAGHGEWWHVDGQQYSAVCRFREFGSASSVVQHRKVTRLLTLADDGERFVSTTRIEDFDSAFRRVGSRCATESARRSS